MVDCVFGVYFKGDEKGDGSLAGLPAWELSPDRVKRLSDNHSVSSL